MPILKNSKKTVQVLELAGQGRVFCAYKGYQKRNGVRGISIVSVDSFRGYGPECKISVPPAEKRGGMGFVLKPERMQEFVLRKKGIADHLHFHMMDDRQIGSGAAGKIIGAIPGSLNKGGLFFFSADYQFFNWKADNFSDGSIFAGISRMAHGEFEVLSEFYNRNQANRAALPKTGGACNKKLWAAIQKDSGIEPKMERGAEKIAAAFGHMLKKPKGMPDFFALFSDYTLLHGIYYLIGRKLG